MSTRISENQVAGTSVCANSIAFQQLAQAYTTIADMGTKRLSTSAYSVVVDRARSLPSTAISNLIDIRATVGLAQANAPTPAIKCPCR